MHSVSLPPVTPTSPGFASWSPLYSVSIEFPEKRLKLDTNTSSNVANKPKRARLDGSGNWGATSLKPVSLSTRGLHREGGLMSKMGPKIDTNSSAGFPSVAKGLSISTKFPDTTAARQTTGAAPISNMVSSMLKASSAAATPATKGLGLPRLSIATKTLPTSQLPAFKRRSPPPPLRISSSSTAPSLVLPSISLAQSPRIKRAASPGFAQTGFGEASPSLYNMPTPSPVSWAPAFFVIPPTPTADCAGLDAKAAGDAGHSSSSGDARWAQKSEPCTPPWPRAGASLKSTIFDHIGQTHLSPMDLRGYMAASMRK
ncbi:hypothetical protein GQ54DRAFT_175416 [Martensiomyces pterosporus]|nr:hypothetical protein GQ54DRAFT_175416 [Martensiomyces pterosporus]